MVITCALVYKEYLILISDKYIQLNAQFALPTEDESWTIASIYIPSSVILD